MGCDKRLLSLGDTSLLEKTFRLCERTFSEVILVGEEPQPPLFEARWIADAEWDKGPIAGIVSALRVKPSMATFIVAGDMPELSPALFDELCAADYRRGVHRVVPGGKRGVEPLCGLYLPTALPIVEKRLSEEKRGLQNLGMLECIVPLSELEAKGILSSWGMRSLNTPEVVEAYRIWKRLGTFSR